VLELVRARLRATWERLLQEPALERTEMNPWTLRSLVAVTLVI
jgi:hypothetical protein